MSRTNEKKNNEKKMCKGAGMGYCPFLVLGHETVDCIATQGLGGRAQVWPACWGAQQSAATRPVARASWPQWCRDTIFVSWKGAAFCVATRHCNTAPSVRYGAVTQRPASDIARATRRCALAAWTLGVRTVHLTQC